MEKSVGLRLGKRSAQSLMLIANDHYLVYKVEVVVWGVALSWMTIIDHFVVDTANNTIVKFIKQLTLLKKNHPKNHEWWAAKVAHVRSYKTIVDNFWTKLWLTISK